MGGDQKKEYYLDGLIISIFKPILIKSFFKI